MHLPNNTLLQGGKYKIIRFISAGGFGCTYEAMDTVNDRRVAIKELFVKDVSDRDENTLTISAFSTNKSALLSKVKRKFLEEANALRSISHPNIVKVFDSFEENGTAYYVMDYIDGLSLHDMVKRNGALPEQKAVKYIKQVAKALEYVHGRNRLHLDIKPGNIMVDQNDNAILIDFGVSKQYDEVNGENTSTLIGKAPGYSPIEQLGNNIQRFTPATDIYALGATLYKCVTGNTPPDATTVLTDGLPTLPSGLKPTTKKAIRQAMKPKVTDRPQSVNQFLDSFKTTTQPKSQPKSQSQSTPRSTTKPRTTSYSSSKPEGSSTWKWILGGIAAVIALFIWIGNNDTSQSSRVSEKETVGNNRKQPVRGTIAGHNYVDLGLSVKWATCNVGASSPSDYGNYYAWGETSTKSIYTENNSSWYNMDNSDLKKKKIINSKGNLMPQYDIAHIKWGGSWRIPTLKEIEELTNRCTWTWVSDGGHNGYRVDGPNGNSIFLPAAGDFNGNNLNGVGSIGDYCSATANLHHFTVYSLSFSSSHHYTIDYYRRLGRSVRPVSD